MGATYAHVNHFECSPSEHDRSLPDRFRPYAEPLDANGYLSDAQVMAVDGLLGCNDCGAPLAWCTRAESWVHADPSAECWLVPVWEGEPLAPAGPDWWVRAIAGRCSHGGHGWDGETCSDAPMCVECGAPADRTAYDELAAADVPVCAECGRSMRLVQP